jgi:AraC family transcriptional regulator of arabinose operon
MRARPKGSGQSIVIVCIEGAGFCQLASGRHAVRSGDALVLPAGTNHCYGADDEDPWTVWWMHLAGSDAAELVNATGATVDTPVLTLPDPARAMTLIDEALTRMEQDESGSAMVAAAGAAWHLMAVLATSWNTAALGRKDPVSLALAQLQQHLADHLTVSDLAKGVGLSTSHFSALFRRALGCGPREYHTRLRMSRSRELLDSTNLPVASIARRVGYDDPFYFARQFRAVHGVTATQYRARVKG